MWLKTARSSPHVSIIYTWRIMFSLPHLTPLIPRKCKKHRWKRLVQKILMMKFPRALAARRYRQCQTYILGLFLAIFSPSQARARANELHFPQLNLETQKLKKWLGQSKIHTKINHNLREYRRPSNFFRRPLKKLMFGANNILDRVNSPDLTLIFLLLVALINSVSPDESASFSCSLSSYRLMAELLGPRTV